MKSVLVVDDSPEACTLLEIVLEEHGYFPLSAASGQEALILVQQMKFDLIISDLEMSNGDGHFLLKELKSIPKSPKVIIVSGDIRATEEHLKLAGAWAFFRKPFVLRHLMDLVNSII